ncbi:hypothetical protein EMIHUDRAFT_219061 [Emiliania huxleyi CCMP1516]|uniref:Uncharacterized protein n=2 Tax=Emiliania huxleyi TaxID=2903 RepID=A0A0D3I5M3_EMIH1|nr:hypothetical protein EMIHUDRAFT_219061 [Emiliania huxleyi CCMP1516]EOD06558.1 hypothetical protein EMIHUDRAFT_219061 [Emiliania huxleyi CCMP1516]|eukprot:XP_005758987.1 hypothetical protein EMIHUDRAFT_219061 [Emiliania huxleyi CCMP1516]
MTSLDHGALHDFDFGSGAPAPSAPWTIIAPCAGGGGAVAVVAGWLLWRWCKRRRLRRIWSQHVLRSDAVNYAWSPSNARFLDAHAQDTPPSARDTTPRFSQAGDDR